MGQDDLDEQESPLGESSATLKEPASVAPSESLDGAGGDGGGGSAGDEAARAANDEPQMARDGADANPGEDVD